MSNIPFDQLKQFNKVAKCLEPHFLTHDSHWMSKRMCSALGSNYDKTKVLFYINDFPICINEEDKTLRRYYKIYKKAYFPINVVYNYITTRPNNNDKYKNYLALIEIYSIWKKLQINKIIRDINIIPNKPPQSIKKNKTKLCNVL